MEPVLPQAGLRGISGLDCSGARRTCKGSLAQPDRPGEGGRPPGACSNQFSSNGDSLNFYVSTANGVKKYDPRYSTYLLIEDSPIINSVPDRQQSAQGGIESLYCR